MNIIIIEENPVSAISLQNTTDIVQLEPTDSVNAILNQSETNAIVYVDQGQPGIDGVSIISATINQNGELIFEFSDSTTVSAGRVVSKCEKYVLAESAAIGATIFTNANLIANSYWIEIDGHSLIASLTMSDGYDWSIDGQVTLNTPLLGGEQVVAQVIGVNSYIDQNITATHNELLGLQGGTVGEYYHLNDQQYLIVNSFSTNGSVVLFNGNTIAYISDIPSLVNYVTFNDLTNSLSSYSTLGHEHTQYALNASLSEYLLSSCSSCFATTGHDHNLIYSTTIHGHVTASISDIKTGGIYINTQVGIQVNNNGTVISTGHKGDRLIDFVSSATITEVFLLSTTNSGTIGIEIYKTNYTNYPSNLQLLSTVTLDNNTYKTNITNLGSWSSVTLNQNDILYFTVTQSTATRDNFTLYLNIQYLPT